MRDNKITGDMGEDFAVLNLIRRGMEISCRNYRASCGEIDIIAIDGDDIAFIEVKVRTQGSMVTPIDAVNRSKQKKIIKTAQIFLEENSYDLYPRYDVFEIYIKDTEEFSVLTFNYIQSAFDGSSR